MEPEEKGWFELSPNQDYWIRVVLYGTVTLAGLLLVGRGGREIWLRMDLFAHGAETKVVVESSKPRYNQQDLTIVYGGNRRVLRASRLSRPDYRPGETITILYDPRDAARAMIGSRTDSPWTIVNGKGSVVESNVMKLILGILLVVTGLLKKRGATREYRKASAERQQRGAFMRRLTQTEGDPSPGDDNPARATLVMAGDGSPEHGPASTLEPVAHTRGATMRARLPRSVPFPAILSFLCHDTAFQMGIYNVLLGMLVRVYAARVGEEVLYTYVFHALGVAQMVGGLWRGFRFVRLLRWGEVQSTLETEWRTDSVPTMPYRRSAKFKWVRKNRLYYRFQTPDGRIRTARTFHFIPDPETIERAEANYAAEFALEREKRLLDARGDYEHLPETPLRVVRLPETYDLIYLPSNPDQSMLFPELHRRLGIRLGDQERWEFVRSSKVLAPVASVILVGTLIAFSDRLLDVARRLLGW